MPEFSISSKNKLYTCHPYIQLICFEVIKYFDFTILEGYRNEEKQNNAFNENKSKLKYPFSKHNKIPSEAIDIIPYPIDWNDINRFIYLAGFMMGISKHLKIKLRWGGNWNNDNNLKNNKFNDFPHFEIML